MIRGRVLEDFDCMLGGFARGLEMGWYSWSASSRNVVDSWIVFSRKREGEEERKKKIPNEHSHRQTRAPMRMRDIVVKKKPPDSSNFFSLFTLLPRLHLSSSPLLLILQVEKCTSKTRPRTSMRPNGPEPSASHLRMGRNL
jgi:hypothetical protein